MYVKRNWARTTTRRKEKNFSTTPAKSNEGKVEAYRELLAAGRFLPGHMLWLRGDPGHGLTGESDRLRRSAAQRARVGLYGAISASGSDSRTHGDNVACSRVWNDPEPLRNLARSVALDQRLVTPVHHS
jgi:hypothetical protein